MLQLYLKTAGMLFVICMGYISKRIGLFSKHDAKIVSKIMLNLTLPSVIISNLNGISISFDLLTAILVGVISNLLLVLAVIILSRKAPVEKRYVYCYCIPLFNVSSYALPLCQTFASQQEIAALLMFNLPTTIFSYVVVPAIVRILCTEEKSADFTKSIKSLFKNIPAITSITMLMLCAAKIYIPASAVSLLNNLSSANTGLAMLSIGLIFELPGRRVLESLSVILIRFGCVSILAAVVYTGLLPLGDLRNIMLLVLFAPMISGGPAMALVQGYQGGDIALALSCYLPISVIFMTLLSTLLFI